MSWGCVTIHASLAAMRTTGDTPQAATAAVISCISWSEMLPCSVSTHIQSGPARARVLERFAPGSIYSTCEDRAKVEDVYMIILATRQR